MVDEEIARLEWDLRRNRGSVWGWFARASVLYARLVCENWRLRWILWRAGL